MSWTTEEKLQLLEGETLAAESLAKTLKIAIQQKMILHEPTSIECIELIDIWFALREQRIKSNDFENPAHIFN